MVECECCSAVQTTNDDVSFNRYMVECEWNQVVPDEYLIAVLIDTWWNVNIINLQATGLRIYGFNRYMVECEYGIRFSLSIMSKVLIDTWWNVN